VLWDRQRDTLKLGQWMRGRIYERRCDLSPKGAHLLYFAMNGQPQRCRGRESIFEFSAKPSK
jgi:hypothetical protein